MDPKKRNTLLAVVGAIVLVAVVVASLLWATNPKRTLDKFLTAVEAGETEQAYTFISKTIKQGKQENIAFFVDDWSLEGDAVSTFVSDRSWRAYVEEDSETGEPLLNEHGFEHRVQLPTPKHWAHHYEADVDVEFDEFEDPVYIKLKRKTDNERNIFSQLFRGWKITNIDYRPFSEEDGEYDFDDEYLDDFELDLEGLEEGEDIIIDDLSDLEDLTVEDDGIEVDLDDEGVLDLSDDTVEESDEETTE